MSTASVASPAPVRTAARAVDWSRLESGVCWAAILCGILLRFYRFWAPSLWLDELGSAFVAQASSWSAFGDFCRFENHPPVYYLLIRPFLWLGRSEFLLRLPSVLLGLATVAVAMAALRRAAGSRAALYGGALLAVNSRAILHSQEARMYAAALFWSALSTYWFLRALENPQRRTLGGYVLSTALAPYTQLLYASVPAAQAAVCLVWLLVGRERPAGLRRLLAAQALVAALLLPLAPLVAAAASFRGMYASWMARPGWEWLSDMLSWPEFSLTVLLLPGLLLGRGPRRAPRPPAPAARGLMAVACSYLAIGPAVFLLALTGVLNVLEPRYLLPFVLGWALAAALVAGRSDQPYLRAGLCTYLVLAVGLQLLIAHRFGPWVGIYPHQDWRAANSWIGARYRPGDLVLLRSGLTHVAVLSPQDQRAQQYLANPVGWFYGDPRLPVLNLPRTGAEMQAGPYPGADAAAQTRRARQVFVLVNPVRERWDWPAVDTWMRAADGSKRLTETRRFDALELRLYTSL